MMDAKPESPKTPQAGADITALCQAGHLAFVHDICLREGFMQEDPVF